MSFFWAFCIISVLLIFLTVIAINFVGDGLRDALDPGRAHRFRGSREAIKAAASQSKFRKARGKELII